MAVGEVTPWTWVQLAMNCMTTLPYWTEEEDRDRTPGSITPGIPPGPQLDKCLCDGQITVMAGEVFYVGDGSFPNRAAVPANIKAGTDKWATTITIEYGRCRPTVTQEGPPADSEIHEAAPGLYQDAWRIWEGLRCCADQWRHTVAPVAVVTGPVPIVGRTITACAAWSFQFTAMVQSCRECPSVEQ